MQDVNNLPSAHKNRNYKQPTLISEHKKREGARHQNLKEQLANGKSTRVRISSTFKLFLQTIAPEVKRNGS